MTSTILIGFDAYERSTLENLLAAGRLPNLRRIVNEGYWTALEPQPIGLYAFPWPSFMQGRTTLDHGWYGVKRWEPKTMRLEATIPEWFAPGGFWDELDSEKYRVALLDVPFAPYPEKKLNGVFLQGWQTHDQQQRGAYPKGLWQDLRARFGPPIMGRELCAPQSPKLLSLVREQVIAATEQFRDICQWTMRDGPWDLFLAVFGGAHRIGHYLWDTTQVASEKLDPTSAAKLESARDEIYCLCDNVLGRLLSEAPPDARFAAFSLHGMAAETGWPEVFARLLAKIDGIDAPPAGHGGMLFRLKQRLPIGLTQRIVRRVPYALSEAIVPIWSKGMYDWKRIRCFPIPGGDSNSLIRINLKGREAQGTVEPGSEYDELCAKIEEGLTSFRDLETGAPIVAKIERADKCREDFDVLHSHIPDLVVHWQPIRAFRTRGVASAEHGEVTWNPGWRIPGGRSGDHSGRGWLAAIGPGIPHERGTTVKDIATLAPTILDWLKGETDTARVRRNDSASLGRGNGGP